VGQDCEVKCGQSLKEMQDVDIIYPDDVNDLQEFPVQCTGRCLSIIFPSSSDFYGRVTIYSLQVRHLISHIHNIIIFYTKTLCYHLLVLITLCITHCMRCYFYRYMAMRYNGCFCLALVF
jgi:hypothetical protein